MASASGRGLMPICCPSGPTSRTSRARIRSLIRARCWPGAWLSPNPLHVGAATSCARCGTMAPVGWSENQRGGRRKADIRRTQRERWSRSPYDPTHSMWPGWGQSPASNVVVARGGYQRCPADDNPKDRVNEPRHPHGERPVEPDRRPARPGRAAVPDPPTSSTTYPRRTSSASTRCRRRSTRCDRSSSPVAGLGGDREPRDGDLRAGRDPPDGTRRRSFPRRCSPSTHSPSLIDGLAGRLGEAEPHAAEALTHLRRPTSRWRRIGSRRGARSRRADAGASEELLRALLADSAELAAMLTDDGSIDYLNPAGPGAGFPLDLRPDDDGRLRPHRRPRSSRGPRGRPPSGLGRPRRVVRDAERRRSHRHRGADLVDDAPPPRRRAATWTARDLSTSVPSTTDSTRRCSRTR